MFIIIFFVGLMLASDRAKNNNATLCYLAFYQHHILVSVGICVVTKKSRAVRGIRKVYFFFGSL